MLGNEVGVPRFSVLRARRPKVRESTKIASLEDEDLPCQGPTVFHFENIPRNCPEDPLCLKRIPFVCLPQVSHMFWSLLND